MTWIFDELESATNGDYWRGVFVCRLREPSGEWRVRGIYCTAHARQSASAGSLCACSDTDKFGRLALELSLATRPHFGVPALGLVGNASFLSPSSSLIIIIITHSHHHSTSSLTIFPFLFSCELCFTEGWAHCPTRCCCSQPPPCTRLHSNRSPSLSGCDLPGRTWTDTTKSSG